MSALKDYKYRIGFEAVAARSRLNAIK